MRYLRVSLLIFHEILFTLIRFTCHYQLPRAHFTFGTSLLFYNSPFIMPWIHIIHNVIQQIFQILRLNPLGLCRYIRYCTNISGFLNLTGTRKAGQEGTHPNS